jgi:hypothetical protein
MNEQERADQLWELINRVRAGQAPAAAGADPLLGMVQGLNAIPLQPSAAATARFEAQLQDWFGQPAPLSQPTSRPRWVLPVAAAAVVIIIAIVIIIIAPNLNVITPPTATPTTTPTYTATPTATVTGTNTETATSTITPTETPTPSATATSTVITTLTPANTGTATPVGFVLVIIEGTIENIGTGQITVFGQVIQIEGALTGWCSGDLVRIEASYDAGGVLRATRERVRVVTSACRPPTAIPGSGGGGGDGGGDDDDD